MCQLQQNLKHIKQRIKVWNKEVFNNIFQAKLQLEKDMENLQMTIIQEMAL
jgi:hypothetical protein